MEITGIQSGDLECWCFLVTKEDFVRVTGEEPNEEFDTGRFAESNSAYRYKLYPSHLFGWDNKDVITLKYEIKPNIIKQS